CPRPYIPAPPVLPAQLGPGQASGLLEYCSFFDASSRFGSQAYRRQRSLTMTGCVRLWDQPSHHRVPGAALVHTGISPNAARAERSSQNDVDTLTASRLVDHATIRLLCCLTPWHSLK